jgi:putative DNA primase/helicase
MRQDFFTYTPKFKLTIVGNHAPALANVDDAMRRRFNIVPFIFKPPVPDKQLEKKLEAEWAGILRWAVDGCLAWQKSGLTRPDTVRAATEDYFSEQDAIKRWLEETCIVEPGNEHRWEAAADLYRSWAAFARASGEEIGSAKGLAPRLRRHGLRDARHGGVRAWEGVSINHNRQWKPAGT